MLVLVAVIAVVVSAPLRAGRAANLEAEESAAHAELAAARDAKYREIREAEIDYRTGKLAEADWRALDRRLRADAVEILRRLDLLEDGEGEAPG